MNPQDSEFITWQANDLNRVVQFTWTRRARGTAYVCKVQHGDLNADTWSDTEHIPTFDAKDITDVFTYINTIRSNP